MSLVERAKSFFPAMRPNKRLGQSFMIDENILRFVIDQADCGGKTVLEVGPGLGFLTEKLAAEAAKVIAIEKDTRFAAALAEMPDNVEIIYGDALKVDWPSFDICVSNLPYQISSPFTFMLLDRNFEKAVLTYQLEFAKRLVAKPGGNEWSRLGATAGFLANAQLLKEVSRNCFWPVPQVDSAVVALTPKKRPENWPQVKTTIDKLFNQPRKTVRSALKRGDLPPEIGDKRVRKVTPQEIERLTTLL